MKNKIKFKEKISESRRNPYTIFPINHRQIWDMYKLAMRSFWTVEEVDLHTDLLHWKQLNESEQAAFNKSAEAVRSMNEVLKTL